MSGTAILAFICVAGGIVGALLGHRNGRLVVGLFLGTFLSVLGWVMILGGTPRRPQLQ